MALTRKFLAAMGIEDDKIDEIITAHTETTTALKSQIAELDDVKKELATTKAALKEATDGDYKAKYEAVNKDFTDLKNKVETEKAHSAKEAAVRAYYESKGIKDGNLKIALRGTNIDAFELDGETLKDTKAIDELIAGDFATLVAKQEAPKQPAKQVIDTGANLGGKPAKKEVETLHDALVEAYSQK